MSAQQSCHSGDKKTRFYGVALNVFVTRQQDRLRAPGRGGPVILVRLRGIFPGSLGSSPSEGTIDVNPLAPKVRRFEEHRTCAGGQSPGGSGLGNRRAGPGDLLTFG